MKTIVEVLASKVQMDHEVEDVREWLQSLDPVDSVQSLQTAMVDAYEGVDNQLKPQFYNVQN